MKRLYWIAVVLLALGLAAAVVWGQQSNTVTMTRPVPSIGTSVEHRWASDLDGKKEADGSEWKRVHWPDYVVRRKDSGAFMKETIESYQLDWCILHGETRVLRKP